MAENKKSFILYADLINIVSKLPKEKAGELFLHILEYVNDLNPVTDDLLLQIAFEPVKLSLKRDLKRYENYIEKQRENGLKGGRPLKSETQITQAFLEKPKKADSVSDSDSVTNIKSIYNPSDARSIDPIKFITFFNSIRNTKYQATAKVKQCLKARCKEYSKEDIIIAIKNAHLDDYHKSTNFKYLTPEFILRTDKIEKFLNAPKEQSNEPKGYSPQLTN
jgi:uncharacterized phage protein (TIGR02220 family)